jgi:extradiol dioxygenase family protein
VTHTGVNASLTLGLSSLSAWYATAARTDALHVVGLAYIRPPSLFFLGRGKLGEWRRFFLGSPVLLLLG